MYKSRCKIHTINQSKRKFFNTTQLGDLADQSMTKIEKFKTHTSEVTRVVIIDHCCATTEPFEAISTELKLINPSIDMCTYMSEYKESYIMYQRHDFSPLNYQDAILSGIIHPASFYCQTSGDSSISKFDLDFAYMYAILKTRFPNGNRIVYVGHDAETWLEQILHTTNDTTNCACVKLTMQHDGKNLIVPIFPYTHTSNSKKAFSNINKNKMSFLTTCRQCIIYASSLNRKKPIIKCNHSKIQRMFTVTCLLEDVTLALDNGYTIVKVFECHVFSNVTKCEGFINLAQTYISLRSQTKYDNDKFGSDLIKSLALQGLGRFAMNYKNIEFSNQLIIESYSKLKFLIDDKELVSYDLIQSINDKHLVCVGTKKIKRFDNVKNFLHRNGVNPLIFACVNNEIRRKIFNDAKMVFTCSNLDLIR
jgi:hypothetical protein